MNNIIKVREEIESLEDKTILDNVSERLDKVLYQYISDLDRCFSYAEKLETKKFSKEVRKWK